MNPKREASDRRAAARAVALPEIVSGDVHSYVQRAVAHLEQASNLLSAMMLDNLENEQIVRDVHDAIGSFGACLGLLQGTSDLMRQREQWQYRSTRYGGTEWIDTSADPAPETVARAMASDLVRHRWAGPWVEEEARPDGRS